MLSRFHTIPACHGQTDGQTDRIAISISRVSVLTRDKTFEHGEQGVALATLANPEPDYALNYLKEVDVLRHNVLGLRFVLAVFYVHVQTPFLQRQTNNRFMALWYRITQVIRCSHKGQTYWNNHWIFMSRMSFLPLNL